MSEALVDRLRPRLPEMTEQLGELVGHESPSDDLELLSTCAAAVAALGERLIGVPASPVEVEGRTHLVWRLGAGVPEVLLVGHYDTVWPRGTLQRWPFSVAEGVATGPGVFDMKAGIVQLFHALSVLPRPLPVAVVLTADEELGSQTSRALIESLADGARAALVLEPSVRGAFKVARKGTSMYEVHVVGRSAHAGLEPEKGINATVELAHQVLAVSQLGRPELGTTVTPTVASAGATTNSVPASAVLHIDARASEPEEQQRVDAAVRALTPVVSGAALRIEGGINRPPMPASSSAELFERANKVAADMGLGQFAGVAVGGASDGNFTAGLGVPTLDGMGADGDGAHAEGEHVVLSAMPERAAVLAGLLTDILTGR
jgi:glutamate carboxypeptidase